MSAVVDDIKRCLDFCCNIKLLLSFEILQERLREYIGSGAGIEIKEKPSSKVKALSARAESAAAITVSWECDKYACMCKAEIYYIESTERVYYLFGYNIIENTQEERVLSDLES